MSKEIISTSAAPQALGPYSQAVRSGGLVFCSGQIPLDADGNLVTGGIAEQTRQVLENLKAVLTAAQMTLGDVVKTTVYLDNLDDFQGMNEIYAEYFGDLRPARATVEVSRLPASVLIEIECIASGERP